MYTDFFGLRCLPFEDRADTQFFFTTGENEETIAAMQYEAQHGNGVLLVTGQPGTGKTIAVRTLLTRLPTTDHSVVLTWSSVGPLDLVRETCKSFGVSLPASPNQSRHISRLRRHLTRVVATKTRAILIIDQAENLTPENLWELAALIDLYDDSGRLLSIILAADPSIARHLDRPEFSRLRQHFFGQRSIPTLNADETGEYIAHRLRVAGAAESGLFTADATRLIHRTSNGVPRLINRICNAAMLAAYAAQRREIGRELIAEPSEARKSHGMVVTHAAATNVPSIPQPISDAVLDAEFEQSISLATTDDSLDFFDAPEWHDPLTGAALVDAAPSQRDEFINDPATTSTTARATVLLDRLERTLDRSERMSATTDAAITKAAAVEKHLASLLDRAERVAKSLTASLQSQVDMKTSIERSIAQLLEDAQRRVNGIQATVTQAANASSQGKQLAAHLQQSCEDARQIDGRISTNARQFADRAEDVQARIKQLLEAVENAHESRSTLQALVATSEQSAERHERLLTESSSIVHERLDSAAKQIIAAATGELRSTTREQAAELEHAARMQMETLRTESDAIVKQQSVTLREQRDHVDALHHELRAKLDDAERAEKRLTDGSLKSHRQALQQLEDAASQRLVKIQESYDSIETRMSSVSSQAEEIARRIIHANENTTDLAAKYDALQNQFDELHTRSDMIAAPLRERVDRAEIAARELDGMTQQIQSAQQQAGATIAAMHTASEHIITARKDAHEIITLTDCSLARLQESQHQVQALHEAADVAGASTLKVTDAISDAERVQRRLEACHAASSATAQRIESAISTAEKASITTECVAVRIEEAARAASEEGEQLRAVTVPARKLHQDLQHTSRSSRALLESLESITAGADESAARLTSHHAAATDVVERLAAENVSAHAAIGRMQSLHTDLTDDMNTAQISLHAAAAEAKANGQRVENQLADLNRCGAILAELQDCIDPTRRIISELNEHAERGRRQAESLHSTLTQTANVTEQLAATSRLLVETREVGDDIRSSTQDARTMHEAAKTIFDQAAEHTARLQSAIEAATASIAHVQELRARTDDASETLAGRLASIETGERLLSEFVRQADDIASAIKHIRQQAAQIETKIDELTARPTAIIDSARAQSAELEKVCTAVRKVFAGLSQAGLDARKQIMELRSAGEQIESRLARLRTGREYETVSFDELEPAADTLEFRDQCADRFAAVESQEPQVGVVRSSFASPTNRAAQIARLLEDAKRSEAANTA